MNRRRVYFPPGTRVRVKGHLREGIREVERVYTDVPGGRRLDKPVADFVSWHITDLVRVPKTRRRRR